jgi:hypothetical protein
LNSATNVFGSNLFELILGWGEECLLFKFQWKCREAIDASQSNF